MTKSPPLFVIDDITMTFHSIGGELKVLDKVSLEIWPGEFVCVVGPNGCGKTTLMHIVAGFVQPTSGGVRINGQVVSKPGPDRPLVMQDLVLFDWQTVLENVLFGLKANKTPNDEALKAASHWIGKLGLHGFEAHYPFELSGGMKQKVALARALVLDPTVLLMDEPFASLDVLTREQLQEEVAQLFTTAKRTVLMVTHSFEEAVFLADRVVVLTHRPARIRDIVEVGIPRPRVPELRFSTEFVRQTKRIWESMPAARSGSQSQ